MLNRNPVVVAKHFQYRLECFFKEVLLSSVNPIEKSFTMLSEKNFKFGVHLMLTACYGPQIVRNLLKITNMTI